MIKKKRHIAILAASISWVLLLIFLNNVLTPEQVKAGRKAVIIAQFTQDSKINTALIRNNVSLIDKDKIDSERTKIIIFSSDPVAELEKLRKDPAVISAGFEVSPTAIPNDPFYNNQWALPKISAPEAWDITTGSPSVKIAILDTGFALSHQDLSAQFMSGRDIIHSDNDPSIGQDCTDNCSPDYRTHGTLVAGIASGHSNNGTGIAGINWVSKIMPIQVLTDTGSGSTDQVAEGIRWATDNGAHVINMSLGGSSDDPALKSAVQYAYSKGVVMVAAAGNSGIRGVFYPAAYSEVLGVGASDSSGNRASFSNYGPELDVLAPGVDTLTTYWTPANPTSNYAYGIGTSLATPHVTGQVSLILSNSPSITNAQVMEIIRTGAEKVQGMGGADFTEQYGSGMINLPRSLCKIGQAGKARPNGVLVRDSLTGKVYLLDQNTKRHFDSPAALISHGFEMGSWINISKNELDSIGEAKNMLIKEGTLIKSINSDQIYIVDEDDGGFKKRWISDLASFNHWGFKGGQIILVDPSEIQKYADGPNLTQSAGVPDGMLLRSPSSGAVYLTEKGTKRWINSPAAFKSHGFKGEFVQNAESFIANVSDGDQLGIRVGTLIKTSNRNEIYVVDISGTVYVKHWIINPSALIMSGVNTKSLQLLTDVEMERYNSSSEVSC